MHDGRYLQISESKTPDGGVVGLGTDISELVQREEALRHSREMLDAVLHAAPVGINAKDTDSRYVFMNGYQAEVYGLAPEDVIGRTPGELVSPEYGSYIGELDRQVIEGGEAVPYFEEEIEDARGERRTWLTTKVPLMDNGGQIRFVVSVSLDMTQHKRMEAEAGHTQTLLTNAIESVSQAVALYDSDDRIVLINSKFGDFFPDVRELLVPGTRFEDLTRVAVERGALAETVDRVDDFVAERVALHRRADGTPLLRQLADGRFLQLASWRTSDGGIVSVGTDVTEAIQRLDSLRESRDQLRLVTDNLPVLTTYIDSDQRYRFVNKTCASWYGRPASDILGRQVEEVQRDAYERFRPRIETVLSGQTVTFEDSLTCGDGVIRGVQATYVPDVGPDGRVLGYFVLAEDVTERKRAEKDPHFSPGSGGIPILFLQSMYWC